MSVVRGRPPGLAGGISGTRRAYCSSLRACPAPKSPTSARVSAVHMTCLQQGSPPAEPPTQPACALAHPSRIGFSNGLLAAPRAERQPARPPAASRGPADRLANCGGFDPERVLAAAIRQVATELTPTGCER